MIVITTTLTTFLGYPVNVNYQYISDTPTMFPGVTICNLNSIDLSYDPDVKNVVNNCLIKNKIAPNIMLDSDELAIIELTAASDILKSCITSDTNMTWAKKANLSFSMETMLVSCFFNDIQCFPFDFKWFWSNDYGNCYTFNAMYDNNGSFVNSRNISQPGVRSGSIFIRYVSYSTS